MYRADGANPVFLNSVSPQVKALEQMNNKHNGMSLDSIHHTQQ